MTFQDDELSYALGKQAGAEQKLQALINLVDRILGYAFLRYLWGICVK